MTPLASSTEPEPAPEEPVAELPEEATDTRFEEKEIKSVLVTGATGGVGKYVIEPFSFSRLFVTVLVPWFDS